MTTLLEREVARQQAGEFGLDPSLVLYLPLHMLDGSSFMSRDHYGHLCTVTGALWTPQGRRFDGINDFVDCGNALITRPTDALTYEVWVTIRTLGADTEGIFGHELGAGGYHMLWLWYNKLAIRLYDRTNTGSATAPSTATLNIPYHVVGTFDVSLPSENVKLFINSAQVATGDLTVPLTTNVGNLYLARYGSLYLHCEIGEVRMYNRALSAEEIQNIYLATKWRYT